MDGRRSKADVWMILQFCVCSRSKGRVEEKVNREM